ncbi:MAG: YggS family pyridoxal phosphate-dependent enzyme [Pseudomonadota bacterium]|nr:YggS family pyridoxal phosphate-dependent enzyme [Pseudomonadota bacterium]
MIADNLLRVNERIASACCRAGRPVQSVTLLVVSKTFAAEAVRAAVGAGGQRFGENYVQEGLDKIAQLADLRGRIEWHMIGPLQSNKTRLVAETFDWVQSVDRLKTAERLSAQRPAGLPALNVCLQVNISGEQSKAGLRPGEVAAAAHAVAELPRLRLRGLMAIPEPTGDFEAQRRPHRDLRLLFEALQGGGLFLDSLSMGMSDDLEAAIAEGATMVRVGSAIFGERPGSDRGPAPDRRP